MEPEDKTAGIHALLDQLETIVRDMERPRLSSYASDLLRLYATTIDDIIQALRQLTAENDKK